MKPFLLGKKNLDIPPLRAPHVHSPVSATGLVRPAPSLAAEPNVEVVKQGDKVVRIVVTCPCGERIEVECLYPAGS
ncbi:MAG: hypothetical protein HYV95_05530 [Opitutae bacterium]|nr:hypothetical protein [Opitutae bacterium]